MVSNPAAGHQGCRPPSCCGSGRHAAISSARESRLQQSKCFWRRPHRGERQHPRPQHPQMGAYLGVPNIAVFYCDLGSFDCKASNPQTVIDIVMRKVDKLSKGIILIHDFHKHTAEALPELLKLLKAGGFKVVAMKAKAPVQVIAKYEEDVVKELKLPTVSARPVSSVVQTISE